MLVKIINDLADNFRKGDEVVLQEIIKEVTADALFISCRKNNDSGILDSNIIKCVKSIYLQRGSEGSNSISDSGISTSFSDAKEIMKKEIVSEGKRVPRL